MVRARGNFDRVTATQPSTAPVRGIVGSRKLAPGTFWRDPLLDILVDGQDIARPLNLRVDSPAEGSHVAAEWVRQRRLPCFPARRPT